MVGSLLDPSNTKWVLKFIERDDVVAMSNSVFLSRGPDSNDLLSRLHNLIGTWRRKVGKCTGTRALSHL